MSRFILCGHTGCFNRGCEAIIKSTGDLIHQMNDQCTLGLHRRKEDLEHGLDEFDELIDYAEFNSMPFSRGISLIMDKILRQEYTAACIRQRKIIKKLKGNIALNVGGDTYCYGEEVAKPYIYLNKYCSSHSIPCFLWGCSIEEEALHSDLIVEDLKRYSLICARESITYQNLLNAGVPEEKVILSADSAFLLKAEKVQLPPDFIDDNMVGFNLSPLVIRCSKDKSILLNNYYRTIDYILENTTMGVALIPHVYKADTMSEDLEALSIIYKHYSNNSRVILFDQFYTCKQLKYIISKCRFFVTARTHASIAAYSSNVPTIVLGYSVKAKGIAEDLFGKVQGYVIPVQELMDEQSLVMALKNMIADEHEIANHLKIGNRVMQERVKNAYLKVKEVSR